MGKFEKDWSDLRESEICQSMEGVLVSRDYSTKGDFEKDGTSYEVKSTKGENLSFGTLANMGQDSLTDLFKCFNGISWVEYRKKTGFESFRWKVFKHYKETKTQTEFYKYANDFKKNCPDICSIIEERSRVDRETYINYLLGLEQSKIMNKIFLFNMLSGRTTKSKYKNDLNFFEKDFKVILDNSKETKTICYEDLVDKEDLNDLKFFRSGRTSISLKSELSDKEYIRISFHWKNKFQGCQTPCLNIFFVSGT